MLCHGCCTLLSDSQKGIMEPKIMSCQDVNNRNYDERCYTWHNNFCYFFLILKTNLLRRTEGLRTKELLTAQVWLIFDHCHHFWPLWNCWSLDTMDKVWIRLWLNAIKFFSPRYFLAKLSGRHNMYPFWISSWKI